MLFPKTLRLDWVDAWPPDPPVEQPTDREHVVANLLGGKPKPGSPSEQAILRINHQQLRCNT